MVPELFALPEEEKPGSFKKSSTASDRHSPSRRTGDNGYCGIPTELSRIPVLFSHG